MLYFRPRRPESSWGAPGTSLVAAHHDRAQRGGHLFFACLWRTSHMESSEDWLRWTYRRMRWRGTQGRWCPRCTEALSIAETSQPLFLRNVTTAMVMHKALYGTASERQQSAITGPSCDRRSAPLKTAARVADKGLAREWLQAFGSRNWRSVPSLHPSIARPKNSRALLDIFAVDGA